jgi:hypothetical protein
MGTTNNFDTPTTTSLAATDTFPVISTATGRGATAPLSTLDTLLNGGTYVRLFDDFLGDVIEDGWSAAKGSDGQAVIAAVQAGAAGGVVRQTTGDTVTLAESCVSLTHALNWKANQGGLVFETRFKPVTSVADVAYFIGFTDVLATTTLEMPATLSTATITYVADDAVGFLYDTSATTDVFYGVGVKATTGIAFANAVVCAAPVADTWVKLRVEVSATGTASFYVDGVLIGSLANAVTATVALTPVVASMARTTTVKAHDIDYVDVKALRA